MEVLVAIGVFFTAMFAILALVANTLRHARSLQQTHVDIGIPASELSLTNRLAEGSEAGDFGDLYPDHRWDCIITEAATNGLFQLDFSVYSQSGASDEKRMSILLFRPESQTGAPRPVFSQPR